MAVVAALGLAALIATSVGGGDDEAAGGETRTVTLAGEPLPALPDGGADPAVGSTAPRVRGEDFAGEPVSIAPDGTPRVLVFLAHWCPHCQREAPVLVEWERGGGLPEGAEMIAVATGTSPDRPNYPPSSWLERIGWSAPVLIDSDTGDVAEAFGLTAFPFIVVLDGEGRVVARTSGAVPVDQLAALLGSGAAEG